MIKIINFLNKRNLQKLKSRADVSGWLLIIILSLDLHRFGAWYTGNQAYIRLNVFPFVCLAGIPIIIYLLADNIYHKVILYPKTEFYNCCKYFIYQVF